MKPEIFIVEDDLSIQELYRLALENEFVCSCFENGRDFFSSLKSRLPDLILLDIMLPGENGYELLVRLKSDRSTASIPVIMVSAKGEEIDKVKGLNSGADDYISKPFGVLELTARIKANLRKNTPSAENLRYKDIIIDQHKHQIIINNTVIPTTLKEYNLLKLLTENANTVQCRDSIFSLIWGSDFMGETRTLDIHIKELRKKLASVNSQASIQTIRGVGYILV